MTSRPLRILDTGTRRPQSTFDGVDLRHQPALVRRPLSIDENAAAGALDRRCHLVFYSQFAVETVVDADLITDPELHRFWAVGDNTADLISEHYRVGVETSDEQNFKALRRQLSLCDEALPIVAFALLDTNRDLSPVARRWSVEVREISVYESTAADEATITEAFDEHRPHWLTMTSSRGVQSVVRALGTRRLRTLQSAKQLQIAAIGPSTAKSLSELGLRADLIAETPDRQGLLEAIVECES